MPRRLATSSTVSVAPSLIPQSDDKPPKTDNTYESLCTKFSRVLRSQNRTRAFSSTRPAGMAIFNQLRLPWPPMPCCNQPKMPPPPPPKSCPDPDLHGDQVLSDLPVAWNANGLNGQPSQDHWDPAPQGQGIWRSIHHVKLSCYCACKAEPL